MLVAAVLILVRGKLTGLEKGRGEVSGVKII
jgi:hypothetical protein